MQRGERPVFFLGLVTLVWILFWYRDAGRASEGDTDWLREEGNGGGEEGKGMTEGGRD